MAGEMRKRSKAMSSLPAIRIWNFLKLVFWLAVGFLVLRFLWLHFPAIFGRFWGFMDGLSGT